MEVRGRKRHSDGQTPRGGVEIPQRHGRGFPTRRRARCSRLHRAAAVHPRGGGRNALACTVASEHPNAVSGIRPPTPVRPGNLTSDVRVPSSDGHGGPKPEKAFGWADVTGWRGDPAAARAWCTHAAAGARPSRAPCCRCSPTRRRARCSRLHSGVRTSERRFRHPTSNSRPIRKSDVGTQTSVIRSPAQRRLRKKSPTRASACTSLARSGCCSVSPSSVRQRLSAT